MKEEEAVEKAEKNVVSSLVSPSCEFLIMYNLGYETVLNFNFFCLLRLSVALPSYFFEEFSEFSIHIICVKEIGCCCTAILNTYFGIVLSLIQPQTPTLQTSLLPPHIHCHSLCCLGRAMLAWPGRKNREKNQCRNDREASEALARQS